MITKYCLKAKFAGIDNELFFEVDEKEFSRSRGAISKYPGPRKRSPSR